MTVTPPPSRPAAKDRASALAKLAKARTGAGTGRSSMAAALGSRPESPSRVSSAVPAEGTRARKQLRRLRDQLPADPPAEALASGEAAESSEDAVPPPRRPPGTRRMVDVACSPRSDASPEGHPGESVPARRASTGSLANPEKGRQEGERQPAAVPMAAGLAEVEAYLFPSGDEEEEPPPPVVKTPVASGKGKQGGTSRKVIQLSLGEAKSLAEKQKSKIDFYLSQNEESPSLFDSVAAPQIAPVRRGKGAEQVDLPPEGGRVPRFQMQSGSSGLPATMAETLPPQVELHGWERKESEGFADMVSRVFKPSGKHKTQFPLSAAVPLKHMFVSEGDFPDSQAPITRGEIVKLLQSVAERQTQRAELLVRAAQETVAPPAPPSAKARNLPKVRAPASWSNVRTGGEVILWLERVGTYLSTGPDLTEEERVNIASSLLEGEALEYWCSVRPGLAEGGKIITYDMFSEALLEQFAPAFRQETAAADLLALREKQGKFDEYRRNFDLLKSKLPFSPKEGFECLLVAMFRRGLHQSTADLVLLDPATGSKHSNLRDLQQQAKVAADSVAAKLKAEPEGKPRREQAPLEYHKGSSQRKGKGRHREQEVKPPSGKVKQGPRCYNCEQIGHLASKCPKAGGRPGPPETQGRERKYWGQGKGKPKR